jgi:predicted porin
VAIASATPAGALATQALLSGLQLHPGDFDLMRGFAASPTDSDAYHLGASWTFGASKLYGVYNWGKDSGRSEWATQDAKAAHFGVAYFYNLSLRTALYGVAAFLKNSDQSRMSLSSAGYTTGWTTGFGEDASAYQLGIRHLF